MALAKIRTYNTKELAVLYEESYKVMRSWLTDIPGLGKQKSRRWSIRQVKLIFEHYGTPEAR